MSTVNNFIAERIATIKLQIIAYEDASLQLATDKIQSFTMDTGQTRETVTKLNSEKLQDAIDQLYNRLVTLEARVTGCGVSTVRPAW